MNTSSARKADFAYVYGLCAISGLRVQIRILRVKRLLRTCMACALEAALSTNASFARRLDLLQLLGDLFEVAMMFVDLFDVAMTVVLDVCQFV